MPLNGAEQNGITLHDRKSLSSKYKWTISRQVKKQLVKWTGKALYTAFVDCGTVQPGQAGTTLQAASHKSGSAQSTKQLPQVYGTEEQQAKSEGARNWQLVVKPTDFPFIWKWHPSRTVTFKKKRLLSRYVSILGGLVDITTVEHSQFSGE